jgi:hypothetical protein
VRDYHNDLRIVAELFRRFSELALILFNKATLNLITTAQKSYPGSLATKDILSGAIPLQQLVVGPSGSGYTLKARSERLGLNAGFFTLTYPEWVEPMVYGAM